MPPTDNYSDQKISDLDDSSVQQDALLDVAMNKKAVKDQKKAEKEKLDKVAETGDIGSLLPEDDDSDN